MPTMALSRRRCLRLPIYLADSSGSFCMEGQRNALEDGPSCTDGSSYLVAQNLGWERTNQACLFLLLQVPVNPSEVGKSFFHVNLVKIALLGSHCCQPQTVKWHVLWRAEHYLMASLCKQGGTRSIGYAYLFHYFPSRTTIHVVASLNGKKIEDQRYASAWISIILKGNC